MDTRASYFRFMENVIYELMCVNIMKNKYASIELWTSILLAVVSSLAVASWFLVGQLAIVFAAIIALAQVVSIAMPYFDLRKKIERLLVASLAMQELADEVEDLWFQVRTAHSDEEINKLLNTLRGRQRKYLAPVQELCRPSEKICDMAEKRMNEYVKNHFYD